MQGEALIKAIEEQWSTKAWWGRGEPEIRLNCPFCGETDHKCYVRAYHDKNTSGKITTYAGSWFCFKGNSADCSGGGGIRDLLPDFHGGKTPHFTDRSEEDGKKAAVLKSIREGRRWINPGETVNLRDVDEKHPGYKYWANRYFNPRLLGEYYGVEYCFAGGGRYQTPGGRCSFDNQGWLSSHDHFIFPVVMNKQKEGWQARARGAPQPLIWTPLKQTAENERPEGYWRVPPAGYPKKEVQIQDPATGKIKTKFVGNPGDQLDTPPKYFHFFDKKTALGNFDLARQFRICVVTEGWTKAIRVGKCGLVTFGKMITDEQLRLLGTYWDKVILLLDRDGANLYHDQPCKRSRSTKPGLVTRLHEMTEVHAVTLDKFDDPGDSSHQEIWRDIRNKTGIAEPKGNADI